ncbi:MAG: conjugative transfer signal peptidase TraF [Pseudomonadota bacterium]
MHFKIFKIIVGGCLLLIVLLIGGAAANLTFNITPSWPLGLYHSKNITENLDGYKEQLVLVCLDPDNPVIRKANDLEILPPGTGCPGRQAPLMKKLVGIPGDQVAITDQGVMINDQLIKNSKIKFKIFEAEYHPGYSHTLQPNEYWIMSDYNANSLDSRYFGPVPRAQIKQSTQPILTIK